ncbi:MAG: DNA polymerase III subunit gamma/tau [Minwuia sp.]|uniref:DNA polymerase III subunit gamma/tau n=1 Tax=Minwuia sp. TaxID=2493630 RepID=UPI003A84D56A
MTEAEPAPYQVLARKYRPQNFDELIGQDGLVRTLSNAIEHDRIHHGYMLTGVRGVGKTTTARIIAKALNCSSADKPTMTPCGTCIDCRQIAEGRHIDVQELDAASRTGVDDMRELLEGVPYLPVQGRRKIYIIDEVHMLSKSSFNALLKTLEEPPEHVIFIFATTEIRKVPVTVLSRCQRFDLKRVPADKLIAHLDRVAKAEGAEIDEGALQIVARAAEGSVRDSLSLLDQAIGHGGGRADTATVREMLGLVDRMQSLNLFEAAMKGEAGEAMVILRQLYDAGAEPQSILEDLLSIAHWLSAERLAPGHEPAEARAEEEREAGQKLAEQLSMPVLSRAWSLLLKGLSETRSAPSPIAAAEMTLIRLAYAADLPDPADLVRRVQQGAESGASAAPSRPAAPPPSNGGGARAAARSAPAADPRPQQATEAQLQTLPQDFQALLQFVEDRNEIRLLGLIEEHVRLVDYQPGRLEIGLEGDPPKDFSQRLVGWLNSHTGARWGIIISNAEGAPTVASARRAALEAERKARENDPLLLEVKKFFPNARVLRDDKLETLPEAPASDDEEIDEP